LLLLVLLKQLRLQGHSLWLVVALRLHLELVPWLQKRP